MKLAVLSDIHGNLAALEAVLADYEALGGADHLWILGDIAAMGPRPVESIRRVKGIVEANKKRKPVEAPADGSPAPELAEADTPEAIAAENAKKISVRVISGNTDRYLVDGSRPLHTKPSENAEEYAALRESVGWMNRMLLWTLGQLSYEEYEFLARLPGECEVFIEGYGHVLGYHGAPGDDERILTADTTDEEFSDVLLDRGGRMGIGGHIHRQFDRTLQLTPWRVINDGSVGVSFEKPGMAQWALITFTDGDAEVDLRNVPYDVEAVIADAIAVGHPDPDWFAGKLRHA